MVKAAPGERGLKQGGDWILDKDEGLWGGTSNCFKQSQAESPPGSPLQSLRTQLSSQLSGLGVSQSFPVELQTQTVAWTHPSISPDCPSLLMKQTRQEVCAVEALILKGVTDHQHRMVWAECPGQLTTSTGWCEPSVWCLGSPHFLPIPLALFLSSSRITGIFCLVRMQRN